MPAILVRMLMAVVPIMLLSACTVGELSRRTHMTLDSPVKLPRGATAIEPTVDIPRAQIGTHCLPSTAPDAASASSQNAKPIFALRPGVGARVTLTTWSAGTLRAALGSGNSSPPELTPTKIALRLVARGERIDPDERAVLASFLTSNRTEWSSDEATNDYPVSEQTRRALAGVLEANQSSIWNAFVRSLCIEVRETAPPGVEARMPAIRAVANMAALCAALPVRSRKAFVAAFIDTRAAAENPNCAGWIVNRSLNGVGQLVDSVAWPAAALAVVTTGGDNDYYDSGSSGSPKTLLGEIEIDAVRPMERGAPHWSLAAWEASGICRYDGEETHIDAVLLRGGAIYLKVVEEKPTYRIVDRHTARDLIRIEGTNPFKARILRSDLKLLTAADVRGLRWKAGENEVKISGCYQVGK